MMWRPAPYGSSWRSMACSCSSAAWAMGSIAITHTTRRCPMQETLIWALMLLAEAFLLSSGILGFLLWRARKLHRRLRAELAEIQRASHAGVAPALSVPAPVAVFDAELA